MENTREERAGREGRWRQPPIVVTSVIQGEAFARTERGDRLKPPSRSRDNHVQKVAMTVGENIRAFVHLSFQETCTLFRHVWLVVDFTGKVAFNLRRS